MKSATFLMTASTIIALFCGAAPAPRIDQNFVFITGTLASFDGVTRPNEQLITVHILQAGGKRAHIVKVQVAAREQWQRSRLLEAGTGAILRITGRIGDLRERTVIIIETFDVIG